MHLGHLFVDVLIRLRISFCDEYDTTRTYSVLLGDLPLNYCSGLIYDFRECNNESRKNMDPAGIEPTTPRCKRGVLPLDYRPNNEPCKSWFIKILLESLQSVTDWYARNFNIDSSVINTIIIK